MGNLHQRIVRFTTNAIKTSTAQFPAHPQRTADKISPPVARGPDMT